MWDSYFILLSYFITAIKPGRLRLSQYVTRVGKGDTSLHITFGR
jgi:hypothetical protein